MWVMLFFVAVIRSSLFVVCNYEQQTTTNK